MSLTLSLSDSDSVDFLCLTESDTLNPSLRLTQWHDWVWDSEQVRAESESVYETVWLWEWDCKFAMDWVSQWLSLWDWVSEWVSDDKRTRTETQIEIQNSEQWWVSEWRVELENLLVLRLPNLIV